MMLGRVPGRGTEEAGRLDLARSLSLRGRCRRDDWGSWLGLRLEPCESQILGGCRGRGGLCWQALLARLGLARSRSDVDAQILERAWAGAEALANQGLLAIGSWLWGYG